MPKKILPQRTPEPLVPASVYLVTILLISVLLSASILVAMTRDQHRPAVYFARDILQPVQ
ncbi:hypothetical protein [Neorhizobium sp. T25_27]|uniref:hypothetical protein n=1 Tax=Neorhizobium sp. T25_27 TaxID=2093831 RepID=UPI00155E69DE|nr:hypothetical protein [Neorhizobium sp. T25_27]